MTLYFRTPEMIAESRRRMLRRMIEDSNSSERVLTFPMELKATENEFIVKAMLPGLSTEEINIQFNNNILTIDGEYTSINEEGKECMFSEMPVGRFSARWRLMTPWWSRRSKPS